MIYFLGICLLAIYLHPNIKSEGAQCSTADGYGPYDEISRRAVFIAGGCIFPDLNNLSENDSTSGEETVTSEKQCPELYRRYSANHTFCKTSSCDTIAQGLTEQDKELILDVHNNLRSKLATGDETRYRELPSAANMMQLEWDDELAQIAQDHANLCTFQHEMFGTDRAVENFPVGQNLMQISTSVKYWEAVRIWYTEEVCFFLPEYIKPSRSGYEYGHFSQVIWAQTWKIGCGFSAYRKNDRSYSLYTCNYGPSSTYSDPPVPPYIETYKEGEPCSQCPKNTECSDEYPGLCKSITSDGPQKDRPPSSDDILYCDFTDEDPEECNNVKITGSKEFETRTIYNGDYKTVVLQGGEHVTINLGEGQNDGGICPFLYVRFGPNDARNSSKSEIEYWFSSEGARISGTRVRSYGSGYVAMGVHMMYGGIMQADITLKAKPEAAPQYFDIKAWGITKGRCRGTSEFLAMSFY